MIHMKLNTIGFYDLPWNEPHLQMETQKITPRISPQSPVGTCMNVGKTQWIFGTCICMYFPQSTNLGSISVREYAIQSLRKLRRTFSLSFLLRAVQLNRPETGLLFSSTTYVRICVRVLLNVIHVHVYMHGILTFLTCMYLRNVLVR